MNEHAANGSLAGFFGNDGNTPNLCFAKDFTARLIDCGMAKRVPDENSKIVQGSVRASVRSTSRRPAFGTPGYMSPEYSRNMNDGTRCPYIAAYDAYSIGIVVIELILGCLSGGQSARNGM